MHSFNRTTYYAIYYFFLTVRSSCLMLRYYWCREDQLTLEILTKHRREDPQPGNQSTNQQSAAASRYLTLHRIASNFLSTNLQPECDVTAGQTQPPRWYAHILILSPRNAPLPITNNLCQVFILGVNFGEGKLVKVALFPPNCPPHAATDSPFSSIESTRNLLRPWTGLLVSHHGQALDPQAREDRLPRAPDRHLPHRGARADDTRQRRAKSGPGEHQKIKGHGCLSG